MTAQQEIEKGNWKIRMHKIHLALAMFIWIILILFIISPQMVLALGVTPAKLASDFTPGKSEEYLMDIINSEKGSFLVSISVSPELQGIVRAEPSEFEVNTRDDRVRVKIIITYPENLDPGIIEGKLVLTPRSPEGGMFRVFVAPEIPVRIRVPYPDKYADAKLVAIGNERPETTRLFAEFENLGSEPLFFAKAELLVNDPETGDALSVMKTDSIAINPREVNKAEFLPGWKLPRGEYPAELYFDNNDDGILSKKETKIIVGSPRIIIQGIAGAAQETGSVNLTYGEINKIVFSAENDWNTVLKAKGVLILDGQASEMPDIVIGAGQSISATGFVDTTGLEEGRHALLIKLTYPGGKSEQALTANVVRPKAAFSQGRATAVLLILAIGVVIMIILRLWLKRRKAV